MTRTLHKHLPVYILRHATPATTLFAFPSLIMSTDEGFRLRNATKRPTDDAEAEAGVTSPDNRQPTTEERTKPLLNFSTMAATRFLNPRKRKHIGVVQSLKAITMSSCAFPMPLRGRTTLKRPSVFLILVLNAFVVFIPLAWVSHFLKLWDHHYGLTFTRTFFLLAVRWSYRF